MQKIFRILMEKSENGYESVMQHAVIHLAQQELSGAAAHLLNFTDLIIQGNICDLLADRRRERKANRVSISEIKTRQNVLEHFGQHKLLQEQMGPQLGAIVYASLTNKFPALKFKAKRYVKDLTTDQEVRVLGKYLVDLYFGNVTNAQWSKQALTAVLQTLLEFQRESATKHIAVLRETLKNLCVKTAEVPKKVQLPKLPPKDPAQKAPQSKIPETQALRTERWHYINLTKLENLFLCALHFCCEEAEITAALGLSLAMIRRYKQITIDYKVAVRGYQQLREQVQEALEKASELPHTIQEALFTAGFTVPEHLVSQAGEEVEEEEQKPKKGNRISMPPQLMKQLLGIIRTSKVSLETIAQQTSTPLKEVEKLLPLDHRRATTRIMKAAFLHTLVVLLLKEKEHLQIVNSRQDFLSSIKVFIEDNTSLLEDRK